MDPTLLQPSSKKSATPAKTPSKFRASANSNNDRLFYSSEYLFQPCSIVKTSTENNLTTALVKISSDGSLHKLQDPDKLIQLCPQDYMGLSDVLHLPNITEASLLHSLRLRYERDEIYTNAGPILISVNPYKVIKFGKENL